MENKNTRETNYLYPVLKYDKHIFICTNQRPANAPRRSCGEAHGMEIAEAFKKKLKEKNLPIKINQSVQNRNKHSSYFPLKNQSKSSHFVPPNQ